MDQKTDHAARRVSIAQAKAEIANAQSAIAQLRAHGAHPKNSVGGAKRDVDIACQALHIAEARLSIVRMKAELPPVHV